MASSPAPELGQNQRQQLKYADFASLVSKVLLDLVREKRIRAIEKSSNSSISSSMSISDPEIGVFKEQLRVRYSEAARDGPKGHCIGYDAVLACLRNSGLGIRAVELEVLMSEVCPLEGELEPLEGLVEAQGFILEVSPFNCTLLRLF
jgi:hypothetical protein